MRPFFGALAGVRGFGGFFFALPDTGWCFRAFERRDGGRAFGVFFPDRPGFLVFFAPGRASAFGRFATGLTAAFPACGSFAAGARRFLFCARAGGSTGLRFFAALPGRGFLAFRRRRGFAFGVCAAGEGERSDHRENERPEAKNPQSSDPHRWIVTYPGHL